VQTCALPIFAEETELLVRPGIEIRTLRQGRTPERDLPPVPDAPEAVEVAMMQEKDRVDRRIERHHEGAAATAHRAMHVVVRLAFENALGAAEAVIVRFGAG